MPYKRAKVSTPYIPQSTRLMDQVREVLRYHHYAIRTEKAYVAWILKYIKFNGTKHPKEMGKHEIEKFLSHLAINGKVAVSTQNQAFNGILFLYKDVLLMPIADKIESVRSKKPKKLPTVLGKKEVSRLIKGSLKNNFRFFALRFRLDLADLFMAKAAVIVNYFKVFAMKNQSKMA